MKIHTLLCFALLFTVSCKSVKDKAARKKQEEAIYDEFDRETTQYRDQARKELAEKGYIENQDQHLDNMLQAAKKIEQSSNSEDAKLGKLMTKWLEIIKEDSVAYEASSKTIENVMDFSHSKSIADIDRRLKEVEHFKTCNAKMLKGVQSEWRAKLKKYADTLNLPPSQSRDFFKGLDSGFTDQKPLLTIVRKTDEEMGDALIEQLKLLKSNHGKWSWSKEEESIVFDHNASDAVLDAYNACNAKIQIAAEKQYQAQQKLLK